MSAPGEDFVLTAVTMKWIILSTEHRGHTNNLLRLHAQILDGLKLGEVNPTISIADWLSSCELGYKLLRVGILPCHLICSAVHVEILLMLIRVIKQDWTQMSNVPSTPVEVYGKTPGNYTRQGIFGLRAKYTQAKKLFSLEVWRIL